MIRREREYPLTGAASDRQSSVRGTRENLLTTLQHQAGNAAVARALQRDFHGQPLHHRRVERPDRPPDFRGVGASPSTAETLRAYAATRGVWVPPQFGPPFVQQLDDCGAASLAAAVLEQDRDSGDPHHRVLRTAITSLHTAVGQGGALRTFVAHAIRGRHPGWTTYLREEVESRLRTALSVVDRDPNAAARELELALYNGFRGTRRSGTTGYEQGRMIEGLGRGAPTRAALPSYDAIFTNPVVLGLRPGETAQINWPVWTSGRQTGQHAFVIGRRNAGTFFLYDQGRGLRLDTPDLASLRTLVDLEADGNRWLYRGPMGEWLGDASAEVLRVGR